MNVELKPIAESKVRQLGGDVCGVLVRNEAGAWAAVSEGGRVIWLDGFEGECAAPDIEIERKRFMASFSGKAELSWLENAQQFASVITQNLWESWQIMAAQFNRQAARAQGGQGAEGFDFDGWYDKHESLFREGVGKSDLRAAYKQGYRDSHPQQGSVPTRDDLIQCLLATQKQSEGVTADAILSMFTTPQADGWVQWLQSGQGAEPVTNDRRAFWQKLQAFVDDYVSGYEFRGDGDYTPNEKEQFLIEDCVAGLLHELSQEGYFYTQPQPSEVEPVAYMFSDDYGRIKIVSGKETAEHWCPPGETVTPLYAHPQPAQQESVPEPVALLREELVRAIAAAPRKPLKEIDGYDIADHLIAEGWTKDPQPAQQGSVPEEWSLTHIDDPATDGYLVKGPGVSYCAWKDKEPWLYLFCEALATTPQPQADGWVKCGELQRDAINHALDVLSNHGDSFTSVGAMQVLEEMISQLPADQEGA